MFNLLAIRSAAVPRLTRLLQDSETPAHAKLDLGDQLAHEESKAAKGATENALRRHNLLPIVFQLFKAFGESGQIGTSFPRS